MDDILDGILGDIQEELYGTDDTSYWQNLADFFQETHDIFIEYSETE